METGSKHDKAELSPVRAGLLVPSSNTVMEVDLYRNLPEHIKKHIRYSFLDAEH